MYVCLPYVCLVPKEMVVGRERAEKQDTHTRS